MDGHASQAPGTVRNIVVWSQMGWTPEQIIEHIGHLSLGQVHAALAYYYANQREMDAAFAEKEAEEGRIEHIHMAKQLA